MKHRQAEKSGASILDASLAGLMTPSSKRLHASREHRSFVSQHCSGAEACASSAKIPAATSVQYCVAGNQRASRTTAMMRRDNDTFLPTCIKANMSIADRIQKASPSRAGKETGLSSWLIRVSLHSSLRHPASSSIERPCRNRGANPTPDSVGSERRTKPANQSPWSHATPHKPSGACGPKPAGTGRPPSEVTADFSSASRADRVARPRRRESSPPAVS